MANNLTAKLTYKRQVCGKLFDTNAVAVVDAQSLLTGCHHLSVDDRDITDHVNNAVTKTAITDMVRRHGQSLPNPLSST